MIAIFQTDMSTVRSERTLALYQGKGHKKDKSTAQSRMSKSEKDKEELSNQKRLGR